MACRRERQRQQEPNKARQLKKAKLYNSEYQRLSKLVRENAVQCHLCGEGYRPLDPWTADHLIPSDPTSPLAPAHRSCNSRRGNKPLA